MECFSADGRVELNGNLCLSSLLVKGMGTLSELCFFSLELQGFMGPPVPVEESLASTVPSFIFGAGFLEPCTHLFRCLSVCSKDFPSLGEAYPDIDRVLDLSGD